MGAFQDHIEAAKWLRDTNGTEVYRPIWAGDACSGCPSAVGLGGHDEQGRQALRAAVTTRIAVPLARHGIVIDAARLE